jgi:hypothetical protein
VRVRLFELRLLAIALSSLWAIGGGTFLIGFRPGGPWDLAVGVTASLPFLVSIGAIFWPPLITSDRASAIVFWDGLVAGLLLVPSIASVARQILTGRSQELLPSAEVIYPFGVALMATTLFVGLGISRKLIPEVGLGRRRLVASVAFALITSILIGGTFAGVSLADDAALQDRPAADSRFGPTRAGLTPPSCDGPIQEAWTASVDLTLWGDVDRNSIGSVDLSGHRLGNDFEWSAQVVRSDLFGQFREERLSGRAWAQGPGQAWRSVDPAALDPDALDASVLADALSPGNRATAEDRGLEYVEGARARHCRIAVDGPTFQASFPQVAWLTRDASLETWRGQLDYWLFGDQELGMVTGSINGNASPVLGPGLQATVSVRLTATDRDAPLVIFPPA